MAAIPASAIVNVVPGVLNAGGTALDLSGLILTNATRVPIGSVLTFSTVATVSAYFGPSAPETVAATIYFSGFDGSTVKPAALLFAQYPAASVAAYLRGGSVAGLTLAQLQAINGVLTVTIDGSPVTSGTINLSAASSFSNAAALIQTALNVSGVTVTYDSVAGAFVITSSTSGTGSTIGYASGSAAVPLRLTQAMGAVTSQGAAAGVPGTVMDQLVAQTQDFVSFTTLYEPSTADGVAFAAWNNAQRNRYVYVLKDTDPTAASVNPTASAGYQIQQAGYSGTYLSFEPSDLGHNIFVLAFLASLNLNEVNGRATIAFKSQAGLIAGVTNQSIADQLIANGYNFYGAYATANDGFVFAYPGSVTGAFDWLDSYINQIWMNNAFQLALMTLLTNVKSIPYNAVGYSMIEAALSDVINQALDFGAIRPGVTLSNQQAAAVNGQAGAEIADTLSQRGWYVLVRNPSGQVRAARGSPPVVFWYTDGQSVQSINLASVEVQ